MSDVIKKKKSKIELRNERYAQLFHTLFLRMRGNCGLNEGWMKLNSTSCKLYISLIGLTAMPKKMLINDPYVTESILMAYSGLNEKLFYKALDDLHKRGFIKVLPTKPGFDSACILLENWPDDMLTPPPDKQEG